MNKTTTQAAELKLFIAELSTLLPFAAKAAGLEVHEKIQKLRLERGDRYIGIWVNKNGKYFHDNWNPIDDDVVAFGLVVDLEIDLFFTDDTVSASSRLLNDSSGVRPFIRHYANDKRKNTRIAILQCAIEIGKRISI